MIMLIRNTNWENVSHVFFLYMKSVLALLLLTRRNMKRVQINYNKKNGKRACQWELQKY